MKRNLILLLGGLSFSAALALAADISHTPLAPSPLLSDDKVPMGRPSSGLPDGKGVPYTASMAQIKAFVQNGMSSAGSGDMTSSVYDPNNVRANVYDRTNHTGSQAISTVTGLQTTLNSKSDTTHNHTGTYEPVIATGTSLQYVRGDKQLGTLSTTAVTEGTNLYHTVLS